jgi:hypothetical protein
MKMRTECYTAIRDAMQASVAKHGGIEEVDRVFLTAYEECDRIKDAEKALRWAIFWASKAMSHADFDLLHDSHIDTALRRIMKELRNG